jgi:hypothetical protein
MINAKYSKLMLISHYTPNDKIGDNP